MSTVPTTYSPGGSSGSGGSDYDPNRPLPPTPVLDPPTPPPEVPDGSTSEPPPAYDPGGAQPAPADDPGGWVGAGTQPAPAYEPGGDVVGGTQPSVPTPYYQDPSGSWMGNDQFDWGSLLPGSGLDAESYSLFNPLLYSGGLYAASAWEGLQRAGGVYAAPGVEGQSFNDLQDLTSFLSQSPQGVAYWNDVFMPYYNFLSSQTSSGGSSSTESSGGGGDGGSFGGADRDALLRAIYGDQAGAALPLFGDLAPGNLGPLALGADSVYGPPAMPPPAAGGGLTLDALQPALTEWARGIYTPRINELLTDMGGMRTAFDNNLGSLQTQLGNLQGNYSQLNRSFNDLSVPSVSDIVRGLSSQFSSLGSQIGGLKIPSVGDINASLRPNFREITRGVGSLPSMGDITNGLAGQFGTIGRQIGALPSVGDITRGLGGSFGNIGAQIQKLPSMGDITNGLAGQFGTIGGLIQGLPSMGDFNNLGGLIGGIPSLQQIIAGVQAPIDSLGGLIQGLPSMGDINNLGGLIGNIPGVGDLINGLSGQFDTMGNLIQGLPSMGDFNNLGGLIDNLNRKFDGLPPGIEPSFVQPFLDALGLGDGTTFPDLLELNNKTLVDRITSAIPSGTTGAGTTPAVPPDAVSLGADLLALLLGFGGDDTTDSGDSGGDGSGDTGGDSGDTVTAGDNPDVTLPDIIDWSQSAQEPLFRGLLTAIGAPNPFDTRMADVLDPAYSKIDRQYDQQRRDLENKYAVRNELGSPAYRAELRELEKNRAEDKGQLQSDWQRTAAASDETIRSSRLTSLGTAIDDAFKRTMTEMAFQNQLQTGANGQSSDLWDAFLKAYDRPTDIQDAGLRELIAGMGGATNWGSSSDMSSLFRALMGDQSNQDQSMADIIGAFFG